MSLQERIEALIEQEVEYRVQQKVTAFVSNISRLYGISASLLLKDTQGLDNRCMGICKNGQRCTASGKFEGYCKRHKPVPKPQQPRRPRVEHTHTLPPLFMPGCPACEKANVAPKKLLIDI